MIDDVRKVEQQDFERVRSICMQAFMSQQLFQMKASILFRKIAFVAHFSIRVKDDNIILVNFTPYLRRV